MKLHKDAYNQLTKQAQDYRRKNKKYGLPYELTERLNKLRKKLSKETG